MKQRRRAPDLDADTLRLVYEFANLHSFVFWPNVALDHVRCAAACAAVNKRWLAVSRQLPTRISGQPPETFGAGKQKRAFECLAMTRRVESLDMYTLGNHAKAPPSSGRTRLELEPLLAMPHLKNLRLSVSALAHNGASVAALGLAVARSGVETCAFRLKTGDQKPKAWIVSPRHADQPLDRLAEAVLASPEASAVLAVRYEQRAADEYNRSLILERRCESPFARLKSLARRNVVRLDAELSLLVLYSHHFAREAAATKRPLALTFEHRMTDANLRRFSRLAKDVSNAIAEVRWTADEARGFRALAALPHLRRVSTVRLSRNTTLRSLPCFATLVELALTGQPAPADIPLSCRDAALRHTVDVSQTATFDLSRHHVLRRLSLVGHGATWILARLPPRPRYVAAEGIIIRPDACESVAEPTLETLRLTCCGDGPFSLADWLRTGVKDCRVVGSMLWSLGPSFDDLRHALSTSSVRHLRLSGLLANHHHTFHGHSPTLVLASSRPPHCAVDDSLAVFFDLLYCPRQDLLP